MRETEFTDDLLPAGHLLAASVRASREAAGLRTVSRGPMRSAASL